MPQETSNSVLIVDDSPEQIRLVSELLRPEGCKIYAALGCEDAFHLLEKHIPSLILLDIVMPGMDGFTFCRQIKQDARLNDIPVIFATAYHDMEYLKKGFEAGGCDYVVKPFIREELLERVKVRIRLSQKRIDLQKAHAELDKFCYTLSHDIRAPLYVINQLSELLQRELEAGNYSEMHTICDMLKEKAFQTASMAGGLHRFSKALYEPMHYETVDMDALVTEVYEELSMLEPERTISFSKQPLPALQGDPALLRVVVQNLLSNALKFSGVRQESIIEVRARQEENQNIYYIQDNGIGIDNQDTKELFGVFRRLNGEAFEGDGIGLATVKRLVERHGGSVELQGKPGEGACAIVTLPA